MILSTIQESKMSTIYLKNSKEVNYFKISESFRERAHLRGALSDEWVAQNRLGKRS